MELMLLAQFASWTIAQWAIFILVVAGIVGIVLVIVRQTGVQIPPFIIQILWILLAVLVGVIAIRFLVQML